ncbi:MAG: CBM9 family sugar-binding protein [Treponema sp.]|nr:CBM9 family sugar-binding protein [Treponema sp.]
MKNRIKILVIIVFVAIIVLTMTTCINMVTNPDNNIWKDIEEKYGITLGPYDYAAPYAETTPIMNGKGDDPVWEKAIWRPIDQLWLGGGNASTSNLTPPPAGTFSGRYKIVWTEDRLYYLVEILDTYLSLTRIANPYNEIYRDDCLELFINEDALGGNHEANNNAFAYHMSYDGENVMDYVSGQSGNPNFTNGYIKRNHHINYVIGNLDLPNRKSLDGTNLYTWEVEMKVFDKNYPINGDPNYTPVVLSEGKKIGFAVAYCNAGPSNSREYFMGNMFIPGANKNVAYQNASVFAKLYLVK